MVDIYSRKVARMPQVIRSAKDGVDTAMETISSVKSIIELGIKELKDADEDASTEAHDSALSELSAANDRLVNARKQIERTRPRSSSAPPMG